MTIYVRQPFNILFMQIPDGNYYLTVLRESSIPSESIRTTISSKNRCYPVFDLFNDTFRQYEYLRQVKYCSLLCRQDPQLMCFYDKYYMCICDSYRFSNCFEFSNTMKYDCSANNVCYNDGRCFLNNETCSTTFMLLITIAAYNRFKVELKQSFMQQFQLKLKKHKDIIITPSILLILGLTRLISSFTLGCMESPRQYWLYLIGYFAAFVSSILTLFVFVLPSKIYRSELNKTVQQWT
ncbi:unnamed protein product [Rotaria sp. Silwood2]|nr:unnamed protein product [Rotaria sp. Silwood2]